jgi:hypothetical protein
MKGVTGEQPVPLPDPLELLKDKSYVALLLMEALIGVPVAPGQTPGRRNHPARLP